MTISKPRLELLKSILMLDQPSLHDFLYEFLIDYYKEEEIWEFDGNYLYAEGDINVCVVAHLDTVHRSQPKSDEIFYDADQYVLWSPVGIGGDDRCGVFIILNLIMHGYKPHVLFTWNEETGGYGAKAAASHIHPKLDFMIQFDRRGSGQSVYYDLDHLEFETYINSFGFDTQWGTYTDICELAPEWKCAAVNLSAGYEREHTSSETIYLKVLNDTLLKAAKILDAYRIEPRAFEYKEKISYSKASSSDTEYVWNIATSSSKKNDSWDSYPCYGCSKVYKWSNLNEMGLCDACEDYRLNKKPSFYNKLSRGTFSV